MDVCADEMEGHLDEKMGGMKILESENLWVPQDS